MWSACGSREDYTLASPGMHHIRDVRAAPAARMRGAGLRKRLAPATLSNATQPSAAAPPTTSLTYGAHCAVRWASRTNQSIDQLNTFQVHGASTGCRQREGRAHAAVQAGYLYWLVSGAWARPCAAF